MFQIINKKQHRQRVTGKIFIFSFLSAMISAIATIFLTPKDGKTMRRLVGDSTSSASQKIQKTSKSLSSKAKNFFANKTDKINEEAKK
jgi:gas vesicle protein